MTQQALVEQVKVAMLVALAEHGSTTDIQEVLVRGSSSRSFPPGAIDKMAHTAITLAFTAGRDAADEDDWQAIETAPQDGSLIWAADHHSMCIAYWAGKYEKCWRNWFKGCRYDNVDLGTDAFLPERIWFEPTHWQPIPKPPSAIRALQPEQGEAIASAPAPPPLARAPSDP